MLGTIASFDLTDSVGSILLDDGTQARFGRSACDFEPVPGTRVDVLSTSAGFRGALKADSIRLAEGRDEHASRVGARDATRGILPPTHDAKTLAATARELAGLTILFDEEIPREAGALLKWALGFGFEQQGIQVDMEGPSLVFTVKGTRIRASASHEAYPIRELDPFMLGPQFSTGKGALALLFPFMPRNYYTRDPDAWLERGHARAMSKIAVALLSRGHAVIVHRAGEIAIDGGAFKRRLGNLDDLECVPFTAWFDTRTFDDKSFGTLGLRAFGLPEVRVEGDIPPASWLSARRFEAVLFASYCICRNMWVKDGLFEVPRRIQVGSYPASLAGPVDVERWEARSEGAGVDLSGNILPMYLMLRHRDDSDDSNALWEAASRIGQSDPKRMGQGGYEALYLNSLQTWLSLGQVGMISALDAPVPHRVITLRGDGPHRVIASSGFGRLAQPGGDRARGSDHVELIAFVPADLVPIGTEIVDVMGETMHAKDRRQLLEPWALYPTALGTFLLKPWGPLSMGTGAPITLLELYPLDPAEVATATANPASRPQVGGAHDQAASAARWAKLAPPPR